jgi:predicted O-methyltransferase YrrM
MRFQQIYSYIEKHKPEVLLEIGTWNGKSAKHMFGLGIKKYIGFDVWEEGTPELDEIENNVKKHVSKEEVEKTLEGHDIELIQGNTRRTLKAYVEGKKPCVDVAIIDGGHSVPTIKNDFLHLLPLMKTDGVIFVDDYYFGCEDRKVGANSVMGDLNIPYTVLPKVDKAKTGEHIYFVKLVRIEMKCSTECLGDG